ncbi:hypothetical protein TNIN_359151, partial [Trichonephila inaurata madagascariensis]
SSGSCAELQREQPHGRVADDQVSRGLRWWTPTEFHSGDFRCRPRGHAEQHDKCHLVFICVRPILNKLLWIVVYAYNLCRKSEPKSLRRAIPCHAGESYSER